MAGTLQLNLFQSIGLTHRSDYLEKPHSACKDLKHLKITHSLWRIAKKIGKEPVYLRYGNYDMNTYGSSIITRDKLIKENPDLVKRFVQSTTNGIAWSIEHPDEDVDIFPL